MGRYYLLSIIPYHPQLYPKSLEKCFLARMGDLDCFFPAFMKIRTVMKVQISDD
jgi:hypothetical protein